MLDNLIDELKVLAEDVLNENDTDNLVSKLDQARGLYEKLLVLQFAVKKEEEKYEEILDESQEELIEDSIASKEEEAIEISEPLFEESIDSKPKEEIKSIEEIKPKEDEPILSLNDLFVPTFDGIKEDMSQKAEFKDTISLDETEKLFQVKKEAPKQLSLNDKLVGSSIQVGLNDRIAFVNKLFNFSQSDFNKALSRLNECKTQEEAVKYFQYQVKPNYNWKGKEDLEERFVSLIERKFM